MGQMVTYSASVAAATVKETAGFSPKANTEVLEQV